VEKSGEFSRRGLYALESFFKGGSIMMRKVIFALLVGVILTSGLAFAAIDEQESIKPILLRPLTR
jgi:hypothetical protein